MFMKEYLLSFLLLSVLLSCTQSKTAKQEDVELSKDDSLMIVLMYPHLDTLQGRWVINITKEEAEKQGVSEKIYLLFEQNVHEVNAFIDSIRTHDPNASINYNLPTK